MSALTGVTTHRIIFVNTDGALIAGYSSIPGALQGARHTRGQFDMYEHQQTGVQRSGWVWYGTFSDGRCVAQRGRRALGVGVG